MQTNYLRKSIDDRVKDKMDKRIDEMIERYLPKISEEDTDELNRIIQDDLFNDNIVVGWYLSEIRDHIPHLTSLSRKNGVDNKDRRDRKKINEENDECILTSGLFCFIGQIILYVSQYGLFTTDVIRDITNFTLMYLYTDYYIDNKIGDVVTLAKLIYDPFQQIDMGNLNGLVSAYRDILTRHPNSKQRMINVFMAEVEGISYQSNPNLSWNDYIRIAEKKGGSTTLAIHSILCRNPSNSNEQIENLGIIIQFIDDMMDVDIDKEKEIHTEATFLIREEGCMDKLWLLCMEKIDKIEAPYLIFKVLFLEAMLYLLTIDGYYNEQLCEKYKKYAHIRYDKGSKMMKILSQAMK